MKEITLKVPDKKFDFFMELINQLGFEVSQQDDISDEQKDMVRARILKSSSDPNTLLNWEEIQDKFNID